MFSFSIVIPSSTPYHLTSASALLFETEIGLLSPFSPNFQIHFFFFVAVNSHPFSKHISLFCLSSLSILEHCFLSPSHTSLYLPLKYPWGQNSIPVPLFLFLSLTLASLPSPRAPSLVYMLIDSWILISSFHLSPELKPKLSTPIPF